MRRLCRHWLSRAASWNGWRQCVRRWWIPCARSSRSWRLPWVWSIRLKVLFGVRGMSRLLLRVRVPLHRKPRGRMPKNRQFSRALRAVVGCSLAVAAVASAQVASDGAHMGWSAYGGAEDGSQYSALKQINRANVKALRQVWSVPTGDVRGYAFNPLVVGETMYVLAQNNSIVALHAATGAQIWAHPLHPKTPLVTNRGLSYWQSADGKDRRLILAVDNHLEEIDAATGKSIESFGKDGHVDLRVG